MAVDTESTKATPAAARPDDEQQHLFEAADAQMRPEAGTSRWIGLSGLPVTGVEVTEHLGATLRLLEERGWVRQSTRKTSPEAGLLETINDSSTTRDCVQAIVKWMRDQCLPQTRDFTLREALGEAEDRDIHWVTMKALEALVSARHGNPCHSIDAWASRRGRTFNEVRELLKITEQFAFHYGPITS